MILFSHMHLLHFVQQIYKHCCHKLVSNLSTFFHRPLNNKKLHKFFNVLYVIFFFSLQTNSKWYYSHIYIYYTLYDKFTNIVVINYASNLSTFFKNPSHLLVIVSKHFMKSQAFYTTFCSNITKEIHNKPKHASKY